MPVDPLCLSEIALHVPTTEPAANAAAYTTLLGEPEPGTGRWAAGNGSVTAEAGQGEAPWAAFAAADVAAAAALLARRGRPVSEVTHRIESAPVIGLTGDAGARADAPVLDHVVFTCASVDSAVALFGGCLGLDFRLVRTFGEVAQLFFRSASVVVEVLVGAGQENADPDATPSDGTLPDVTLWGVAWRCADLDVEHARLTDAGLALSEVRAGRKPGTRVATIRETALGVPTILIEQQSR